MAEDYDPSEKLQKEFGVGRTASRAMANLLVAESSYDVTDFENFAVKLPTVAARFDALKAIPEDKRSSEVKVALESWAEVRSFIADALGLVEPPAPEPDPEEKKDESAEGKDDEKADDAAPADSEDMKDEKPEAVSEDERLKDALFEDLIKLFAARGLVAAKSTDTQSADGGKQGDAEAAKPDDGRSEKEISFSQNLDESGDGKDTDGSDED